jgi:hypothetical protein
MIEYPQLLKYLIESNFVKPYSKLDSKNKSEATFALKKLRNRPKCTQTEKDRNLLLESLQKFYSQDKINRTRAK